MIGSHKFPFIEKLKMTRAEEYDYNKFLSDSSDDYPKYADGLSDECFEEKLVHELERGKPDALSIVLQLAKDHLSYLYGETLPDYDDGTMGISVNMSKEEQSARDSIKIVEKRIFAS